MNVKNKIISVIIASIAIYAIFSIYADFNRLITTIGTFNWVYLPLILGLTFLNYILRFLKWNFYLNFIGVDVNPKRSAGIFLSGLSMSITPAKLGETFKSYLLKEFNGINISKTIPIIIAERSTDLIGLIILATIGYSSLKYGRSILLIATLVIFVVVVILRSKRVYLAIIQSNIPYLSNFIEKFHSIYESSSLLFSTKPLVIAIGISVSSWFFECLAFFYVLKGFGLNVPILLPIFAFSFSTVAGAISMIPGGLGIAEGSLTGILILSNVSKTIAIASTLIIRFCTLWFGVLIGIIILSSYGFNLSDFNLKPKKRDV